MKKQIRNVFCSFFNSFLTSKNQLHIMRSTGMTTQQNVPKISFLKKGSSALDFVRLQEIGCGMYHINIVNLFCVKISILLN